MSGTGICAELGGYRRSVIDAEYYMVSPLLSADAPLVQKGRIVMCNYLTVKSKDGAD